MSIAISTASGQISCDKWSIAAPRKNPDNEQYVLVQPIVGIFAECYTRHTSDNKFILLIEVEFMGKIGKIEKIGKIGTIGRIGTIGPRYPRLIDPINPIKRSAPIDPTKFHQALALLSILL